VDLLILGFIQVSTEIYPGFSSIVFTGSVTWEHSVGCSLSSS
jgi:hypothetical protein